MPAGWYGPCSIPGCDARLTPLVRLDRARRIRRLRRRLCARGRHRLRSGRAAACCSGCSPSRFGFAAVGASYAALFARAVAFIFRLRHGAGTKRSLVAAALAHPASRAPPCARADTIGTGDVLRHLFAAPFGQPLVAAAAVGLFAYAAFMLLEAAWRRSVRQESSLR